MRRTPPSTVTREIARLAWTFRQASADQHSGMASPDELRELASARTGSRVPISDDILGRNVLRLDLRVRQIRARKTCLCPCERWRPHRCPITSDVTMILRMLFARVH